MRSKPTKKPKPKQIHRSIAQKKRSQKAPRSQALVIRHSPKGCGGKVRRRPTLCLVNLPYAQRKQLEETLGQEGILYRTQQFKRQSHKQKIRKLKKRGTTPAPDKKSRSLESMQDDPMAEKPKAKDKDNEKKGK